MMNKTKNYKLNKPEVTDYYNIEDFNNNSEIIDNELFKKIDKIEASQNNIIIAGSAGSLADSGVAIDSVSKKISNPIKNNILAVDPTGEKINSGVHISELTDGLVPSEVGYGGLRYVDKDLQAFINNKWETIFHKTQTRIAFEDDFNRSGDIGNGWSFKWLWTGVGMDIEQGNSRYAQGHHYLTGDGVYHMSMWARKNNKSFTNAILTRHDSKYKLPAKLELIFKPNFNRQFWVGLNNPTSVFNTSCRNLVGTSKFTGIELWSMGTPQPQLTYYNNGIRIHGESTANIHADENNRLEIEFQKTKIKVKLYHPNNPTPVIESEHSAEYVYPGNELVLAWLLGANGNNLYHHWVSVDNITITETLF